jgi:hypothetical protein
MFSAFQSNAFQRNAFQIVTQVVSAITGGGISKKARKQARRYYVEYNNEILVFANAELASNWLEVQKQAKQATKAKIKKRVKELKVEPPLEAIDLTAVKNIAERYGKVSNVNELLQQDNFADVVTYYKDLLKLQLEVIVQRARDEEDEIEMLLLAM